MVSDGQSEEQSPSASAVEKLKRDTQGRAWMLVLWKEQFVEVCKKWDKVRALVISVENAPTTDRVHWHVYVRFSVPRRFSWFLLQFPGSDIEMRRRSELAAAEYVRKEGRVLVDYGCEVKKSASGDVADQVIDMLEAGAPRWQVYREHPRFYFYNRRRITDMEEDLNEWRRLGFDFKRYKRDGTDERVKDE